MRINCIVTPFLSAAFLLSAAAFASEPIRIEAGATHSGVLETRNSGIRIGDEARIDGRVVSRNGSIEVGRSVVSGDVSARNGAIRMGADGQFGDVVNRNGTIELGERSQAGRVESRNGSLVIGASSRTGELETRNGSITIGEGSEVGGVETRNGSIRGQSGVIVQGNIDSRNGGVRLGADSIVSGGITSRNGNIELDQTIVGRNLQGRGGDIAVRGSRIDGDVTIEVAEHDRSGWLWFRSHHSWSDAGSIRILDGSEIGGDVVLLLPDDYDGKMPTVEVDASSSVSGSLRVDGRANLKIAD